MSGTLNEYAAIVGEDVIGHLRQLARGLEGCKVVHVNSTREGGGVAEILHWLVPLKRELGLDASWEVIMGDEPFFHCTKSFHNALQGQSVSIPESLLRGYEDCNRKNAEHLREQLESADFVVIHDPQPAPLLNFCPNRKGKWIWRCHVDVSRPYRPVWKYLREHVQGYDASIWSLAEFAQPMPHPIYLIPPSIDPLSEKNRELPQFEVEAVRSQFGLDPQRPMIVQISRFDRFKDPVGVIRAYKLARKFTPLQLVLAGGGATDDPEGAKVYAEVREASDNDSDIHVLLLPNDAHRTVNALQRLTDIAVQKSVREGFGLTVTEAMWKGRAVIGGDTGGIRLQVINHHTGFLVNTPEGAALRIRYLLKHRDQLEMMGRKARQFVLENFLLTRYLREYLTLMLAVVHQTMDRIEL
ncbi:MAG: glycosyltransferase [Syntrophobacteraceae bacterium]|jgi:trehalose synthase|nr:glycosyltransferase [Syntrophobacteraceae bacterium]